MSALIDLPADRLIIELPNPPSINHAYHEISLPGKRTPDRPNPKPRRMRVPTEEMKAYKHAVGFMLRRAGWKPDAGEMGFIIRWRRAIRNGDLTNRVKVLEDALKGYAWLDDGQVVEAHQYRADDSVNPGVTLEVWVVTPAPLALL